MKLYSADISPYASRVRIHIHHKKLPVQIVPPPGGMRSAQVLARNPIGKIPVLELGDDSLYESFAIMEYLESQFPDPPMWPTDPLARAKLSALVRFADVQLAVAMFPMFLALRGKGGPDTIKDSLTSMDMQFGILEKLISAKPRVGGATLDLADAALLPIVWYGRVLVRHFGKKEVLDGLAATTAWWQSASNVPASATVLGELETGLRAVLPMLFEA